MYACSAGTFDPIHMAHFGLPKRLGKSMGWIEFYLYRRAILRIKRRRV